MLVSVHHRFRYSTTSSETKNQLTTTNLPPIRLGGVGWRVVVQAVHDSAEDQSQTWPNHGSGPNEEPTEHTSNTEAHCLRREDKENLEAPAPELLVVDLLSQKDVEGITETSTGGSHDSDESVFLLVEGAGVKFDLPAEYAERLLWDVLGPAHTHRVSNELDDGRANGDTEVVVVQEDIHGGNDSARQEADGPGPNGVNR